jgi:hypothetical protein
MSQFQPFNLDWFTSQPRTPFFCEENVWLLCRDAPWVSRLWAVVVTSPSGAVAMWSQRAAAADPIVWDYHVVAVVEADDGGVFVVDSDCRDGPVLPLSAWLEASFRAGVRDDLLPRFRVMPAAVYVEALASDRSHMRDDAGAPIQPFPMWPPPHPDRPPTLARLVDIDDDIAGVVVDVDGLAGAFGVPLDLQPLTPEPP